MSREGPTEQSPLRDAVKTSSKERVPSTRIIASIGTAEEFAPYFAGKMAELIPDPVDWFGSTEQYDALDQKYPARNNKYVISALDGANKESHGYGNCVGVVAIGTDAITGKNISILTHGVPGSMLRTDSEEFKKHLREQFDELVKRAKPNTIDVVIFGGNGSDFVPPTWREREQGRKRLLQRMKDALQKDTHNLHDQNLYLDTIKAFEQPLPKEKIVTPADEYREVVRLIGSIAHAATGHQAEVITGPNRDGPEIQGRQAVDVILDTQHRRLFMLRPTQDQGAHEGSFKARTVGGQMKKWKRLRK